MSCNGNNHPPWCGCPFAGATGSGDAEAAAEVDASRQLRLTRSRGWSRSRGDGTVVSYTNPNARCPVCGCPVIFYRSPHDGRVFFDPPLGPPWPKHPCTDTRLQGRENRLKYDPTPYRASQALNSSAAIVPMSRSNEPTRREEGWTPLCSSRVFVSDGQMNLTGDVQGKFAELSLLDVPAFDRDGPIWLRPHNEFPYFYVVAVLQSDPFETHERYHFAFDRKLAAIGLDVLSRAANDEDAVAIGAIGEFLLYEAGDLSGAVVYLQRAFSDGQDTSLDLAVASLFHGAEPSNDFDKMATPAA